MAAIIKAVGGIFRGAGRAIDDLGCALQGSLAYRESRKYLTNTHIMKIQIPTHLLIIHSPLTPVSLIAHHTQ
jgi:hypothetical protein